MRSQLTNSHKLTRGGDCPLQQAGEAVRGALPFLDSRFLRCCHFIKAGLKTVLIDGVNFCTASVTKTRQHGGANSP
jgi:hypothetical protein